MNRLILHGEIRAMEATCVQIRQMGEGDTET